MWTLTAVGVSSWFLFSTASLAYLPKTIIMLAALAGLAIATALVRGVPLIPLIELFKSAENRFDAIFAAAGGVLALWAAPALVLSQRASDAPPGTETLLFSVVLAGVVVVVTSVAYRADHRPVTAIPAAIVSAVGAAAVLGNWERPSSFSPLVRYPGREGVMLVAALLFAVGTLVIIRAEKGPLGSRRARALSVYGATAVAVVFGVPSLISSSILPSARPLMLFLAVSYTAFGLGWLWCVSEIGPVASASALSVAPVLLTALIFVERALGVRGTDPILWGGALPGLITCAAGALAVSLAGRDDSSSDGDHLPAPDAPSFLPRVRRALPALAASAILLAALTLWLPAIDQASEGITGVEDEMFSVEWVVSGYQSAAGWAAFGAGVGAFGVAWAVRRGGGRTVWGSLAIAALVAGVSSLFLGSTTFATWTSWIPGDVQQAYGTEYARLSVSAIQHPIRILSVAFSVAVILCAAACDLLVRGKSATSERNA